ncbi:hypothetical protein DICVIV_03586 [Dictyocaulus viviparus]|uniref:Uncharacterized protein n=1 Tax=Dictyocaulus viviparus TaxID=29172 RepID=A0A0D8Y0C1_DICVI|nr:hypothetical protein DICVIV_03586 [Dictyocaulus viviparus]
MNRSSEEVDPAAIFDAFRQNDENIKYLFGGVTVDADNHVKVNNDCQPWQTGYNWGYGSTSLLLVPKILLLTAKNVVIVNNFLLCERKDFLVYQRYFSSQRISLHGESAKAIMLPYALRHLSRAEDWLAEQWELRLANFLMFVRARISNFLFLLPSGL